MEKQPVDDLFARKLRDADIPLNPDVFGQLQSRMGAKPLPARQTSVWWAASAACLLLMAGVTYLLQTNVFEKGQRVAVGKIKATQPVAAKDVSNRREVAADNRKRLKQNVPLTGNNNPVGKPIALSKLLAEKSSSSGTLGQGTAPVEEFSQTERPSKPNDEYIVEPKLKPIEPSSIAKLKSVPVLQTSRKEAAATIHESIVVMTIDEAPVRPTSVLASTDFRETGKGSFGALIGKLKQLKNGEVLAKATPIIAHTEHRSRLGRAFSGVKESLKNETTLE